MFTLSRRMLLLAALLTLPLAVAYARGAPIYNVERATFSSPIAFDKLERAIAAAGVGLGWKITAVSAGVMEGRLDIRKHMALVEIQFDDQSFSIYYKDSDNLNYNDGTIHGNYNKWVKNLERNIQKQIILMGG